MKYVILSQDFYSYVKKLSKLCMNDNGRRWILTVFHRYLTTDYNELTVDDKKQFKSWVMYLNTLPPNKDLTHYSVEDLKHSIDVRNSRMYNTRSINNVSGLGSIKKVLECTSGRTWYLLQDAKALMYESAMTYNRFPDSTIVYSLRTNTLPLVTGVGQNDTFSFLGKNNAPAKPEYKNDILELIDKLQIKSDSSLYKSGILVRNNSVQDIKDVITKPDSVLSSQEFEFIYTHGAKIRQCTVQGDIALFLIKNLDSIVGKNAILSGAANVLNCTFNTVSCNNFVGTIKDCTIDNLSAGNCRLNLASEVKKALTLLGGVCYADNIKASDLLATDVILKVDTIQSNTVTFNNCVFKSAPVVQCTSCRIENCQMPRLPRLEKCENLTIRRTSFTNLQPMTLDTLILDTVPVTYLPKGISVRHLDIRNTQIRKLPSDLKVSESFITNKYLPKNAIYESLAGCRNCTIQETV